jgi:alpha-acetolactate decarboxylase
VAGYTLLHNVGEYNQPLYTEEPVSGYNVGVFNQPLYTEEPVSGYNVGEYNPLLSMIQ